MDKKTLKPYLLLISFAIGLVLVVVYFREILCGIRFFFRLLTPFWAAIVIAFVLNRPYEWFRGWYGRKMRVRAKPAKTAAILTVYVIAFGAVILLLRLVVPELVQNVKMFAEDADLYLEEIQTTLNRAAEFLNLQSFDLSALTVTLEKFLGTITNTIDDRLPQIIGVTINVVSKIANGFIALALSVYLLSGKEALLAQIKRVLRVYLPKRAQHGLAEFSQIVLQVFGDYVAGQCKEAVILGSLCFIGMLILRLDYAGLVSVSISVTALIPILGAFLGGAIGVLLLLFISPAKAFVFLIFLIVLQQIEGNVIYPKVVGRKIGLPGIWVLLGITVGGKLLGIWGMLLAVPITTILYQLLKKNVWERETAGNASRIQNI